VVVLDLVLPDAYGLDLLAWLRSKRNNTPVLITTARDAISDRIRGLDSGADDYLIKPFEIEELYARLRSLVRRLNDRADTVLILGDISLDPASHQVLRDGVQLDLSPKEFMLLKLLMENAGKFLTKSRIIESIYNWDDEIKSNTAEVYISTLRKKIGKERIRMMRNIGYRMEKPAH